MSKTSDTPNFSHGTKDHGSVADSELAAVTGGSKGGPVTLRDLAKILGELEQAQAVKVR
jgi:hypothetical protein